MFSFRYLANSHTHWFDFKAQFTLIILHGWRALQMSKSREKPSFSLVSPPPLIHTGRGTLHRLLAIFYLSVLGK